MRISEVDQAKQVGPGVNTAVVHAHLDLMTLRHDPRAVLAERLPDAFADVKVTAGPDLGWIGYLGKGAVPQLIADGRNPKVLYAFGRKLDKWEAVVGHRRPFWFRGAYDLRRCNAMALGAGIANALADPKNWSNLDGAVRRTQARRWAKRLSSVRKYGKYGPFFSGGCRLDGPLGASGRYAVREVGPA